VAATQKQPEDRHRQLVRKPRIGEKGWQITPIGLRSLRCRTEMKKVHSTAIVTLFSIVGGVHPIPGNEN
jgi:hypothetical protein